MMSAKKERVEVELGSLHLHSIEGGLIVSVGVLSLKDEILHVTVVRDMQTFTGKLRLRTMANALTGALSEEDPDVSKG